MARFVTCHTCMYPAATCPTREMIQSAIAGLGITSIKHRCPGYAPAFTPGEAVKVTTFAWFHRDDDDPPPKVAFPGHFVQLSGQRAIVHVRKGVGDLDGAGVEFEPQGKGYLKIPLARVAHRDAASIDPTECSQCGAIPGLGEPCSRDPIYTPVEKCLALQSEPAKDQLHEP